MSDFDDILRRMKTGAEKAGESVGDFLKYTASKVENKTKEAKIHYGIRGAEARKKNNFEAIGEAMYNAYMAGTEPEDFSQLYGMIDALNEEIAELKGQLGEN